MSLPKIFTVAALMFAFGCTAHAHTRHSVKPAHHTSINVHWTWIGGHWSHGHWVKGYWTPRPGRHPRAHHSGWRWIDGHYVGHGPHRQWVPGHWKRTRRA